MQANVEREGNVVRKRLTGRAGTRLSLCALALVVVVGTLVWQLLPDDSTSAVVVDDALARYRQMVDREPVRAQELEGLPAPGLYRYAVRGGESLDALLDSSHDYTGTAIVVVVRDSCGVEERWRVLRERWSASLLCRDGDRTHLVELRDHHEFFGDAKDSVYSCRPVGADGTICEAGDEAVAYETRDLGSERIEVDGRELRAEHLRSDLRLSGATTGAGRVDEWRRVGDGLLLRRRQWTSASFSAGEYTESYEIELQGAGTGA